MKLFDKIKNNHTLMMIICCVLPLAILFVAIRYLTISNPYLYWGIILLCPISHLLMMKYMHKSDENKNDPDKTKGGGCH